VLQLVARQATGSMRDAISLLDQLSAIGQEISLEAAQAVLGTATSQAVIDLVEALLNGDSAKAMDTLHASLDAGSDPRQFARQVVEYLRGVMLVRMGNADMVDTTREARQFMAQHAQGFSSDEELLRVLRAFNASATEARGAWQPSLPLELAIVEAGSAPQAQAAPRPVESAPAVEAPPRQAPPVQAKAQPAQASAPGKDAQALKQQWKKIVLKVRETSPNTTGLLNSCQYDFENNILKLYFSSSLLKEKMEEEKHLSVLKQAAEEVLGEMVEVACFVSDGGGLPPGVDSSGRVAAAMRLGGQIVDINDLGSGSDPDK